MLVFSAFIRIYVDNLALCQMLGCEEGTSTFILEPFLYFLLEFYLNSRYFLLPRAYVLLMIKS